MASPPRILQVARKPHFTTEHGWEGHVTCVRQFYFFRTVTRAKSGVLKCPAGTDRRPNRRPHCLHTARLLREDRGRLGSLSSSGSLQRADQGRCSPASCRRSPPERKSKGEKGKQVKVQSPDSKGRILLEHVCTQVDLPTRQQDGTDQALSCAWQL